MHFDDAYPIFWCLMNCLHLNLSSNIASKRDPRGSEPLYYHIIDVLDCKVSSWSFKIKLWLIVQRKSMLIYFHFRG
jgi:hypothetical protein